MQNFDCMYLYNFNSYIPVVHLTLKPLRGGSIDPTTFSNSQNFFSDCGIRVGFGDFYLQSILKAPVESNLPKVFRIFLKKIISAPRYLGGLIDPPLSGLRYGNLNFYLFNFFFKRF